MLRVDEDSYLGDTVTSSRSNAKNIKVRCGRGLGIISNIMIILSETCLGEFYFTVAVILRESLLFSSMLLSSEIWFNITKQEMEQLERVDKALLRKLLCVSSKSVVCGMFLELGLWPIKVVLIGKRVMFLHYILSQPETDLVYRVFQAQDKHPVKNDWATQVRKDLEDLGMSDF